MEQPREHAADRRRQPLYLYHCRLFDRYRRDVVSLAILADERANWRPAVYAAERWGCGTRFEYPVIKLVDWRDRRAALEAGDNPFATIVLAHLTALDTRKDLDARRRAKMGLIRRLYERGYDRQRVLDLFRFIDWLLALPAEAEADVWREIERIEEERKMPYITSVERRGLEQGRVEGKREALLRQLRVRFGAMPEALERRIATADEAALDGLLDRVIVAARVEDL